MKHNRRGRPSISLNGKQTLVQKLEPYLKAGFSIRVACLQSGVPRSTLYDLMAADSDFSDQIKRLQNYISVVTMGVFTKELLAIYNKQRSGEKLGWQDLKFLMWFAINTRHCKEEFGMQSRKQQLYDPQAEITRLTKMIDSYATS